MNIQIALPPNKVSKKKLHSVTEKHGKMLDILLYRWYNEL